MNNTEGNVLSFIAGIAIGGLIGILVAPYRGAETRQRLVDKSKELKDELDHQLDISKDQLGKFAESMAQQSKEVIEKYKKAAETAASNQQG